MTIQDILATAGAVILSLGGGALIVLAFSTWLGKVWADRILEKERAELHRLAFEHETRFSWYHQRKAELIANVYALLNDVTEYVKELVSPVQFGDDAARGAHAKATSDLYNKLAAEYWGKKIFLDKQVCEKIEAIITEVRNAISNFKISQDPQMKNVKLWAAAYQSMSKNVPPLLIELEESFRSMLSKIGPSA
jgi:hypothetical protein